MTTHTTSIQARSVIPFQIVSCALAGLALATALTQGVRCCAQAPVRIPRPTDELLSANSNQSIADLVTQVSTISDDDKDTDLGGSAASTEADAIELGDDEPTGSLKKASSDGTNAETSQQSDQSLRTQTTNKHFAQLRKPLREIDLKFGSEAQTVPENKAESFTEGEMPRFINSMGYPVPPPDRYTICQTHRPLYFEQPNLERCGNGFCVFQNAVSGATFLMNTITLPCKILKQRPDCEIPSGRDCKTCQTYPVH
jgi:hypothetical protein